MRLEDRQGAIVLSMKEDKAFLKHMDLLIVGDNSAGKSQTLKKIIRALGTDKAYFIDSVNREIPMGYTGNGNLLSPYYNYSDIIDYRLNGTGIFNKKDSFTSNDQAGVLIESLGEFDPEDYMEIVDLFKSNFNIFLESEFNEALGKKIFTFDGKLQGELSSGIQAKIRIFLELIYAHFKGYRIFLIDEIAINIDVPEALELLNKIKNFFKDCRFIISTHSIYTILGVQNFDILKIYKQYSDIKENQTELLNSNDYDSLEVIDTKFFGNNYKKDEEMIILSNWMREYVEERFCEWDSLNAMTPNSTRGKIIKKYILGGRL